MKRRLRTLIVDDEPVARQVLREELELEPDVEVVGEAGDGEEALRKIEELKPDVVFLDLQMPGVGGFEVAARIHSKPLPVVVMVTAYDQYALEAFEAGAVDYLLKPVSGARLRRAVERSEKLCMNPSLVAGRLRSIQEAALPQSLVRRVPGRAGDERFLLSIEEIAAVEAEGDAVWLVTAKRRYAAEETLAELEAKLHSGGFRRVRRNAVVNVRYVRKMAPLTSRRWLLTLTTGAEYVISKRQAALAKEILSI